MDAATVVVAQFGGTCTWAELRQVLPKRAIRRAVSDGVLLRASKGRYLLPELAENRRTAVALTAVASHTTAALHWGWGVKKEPVHPHLTFPRGRKRRGRAASAVCHWRSLEPGDVVDGWVTSQVRTVIDCCLDLPFDEALAVADSSWRAGLDPRTVASRAALLPARSRRRVASVITQADRGAANPFESVLRALCILAGADLATQCVIKDKDFYARVDLAVEELSIVVEAESFEHHADRDSLRSDCRRYTGLAARGWVVLRFTWHEVMYEQDYVIAAVRATIEARRRTTTTSSQPA
jgi:very-short-patch-repair endonuclease